MDQSQFDQDMKLRRAIDEEERLAALREYDILDTRPERDFDLVAELVRSSCNMSWAAVTLVDRERQWFKARKGFDLSQTPRSVSFCSVAMHLNEPLVVEDAQRDRRFAHNELVTSDPNLRFYAGSPIVSSEGYPLGALCIIDFKPRTLFPSQLQTLSRGRDWVQARLELRRLERLLAATDPDNAAAYKHAHQLRAFAQFRVDEAWALVASRPRAPRVPPPRPVAPAPSRGKACLASPAGIRP